MPGYIMHLAEGRLLEKTLTDREFLKGERDLSLFQDGLLLPDTKRKKEKITSHFWNEKDLTRLAIPPDLELFYQKYREKLHTPVFLGYWAHLHLDRIFVTEFWPENFRFLDDDGKEQVLGDKIRRVYLLKQKITVPVQEFYSGAWYYGDYSRMNARFIEKYDICVPDIVSGCADGIAEVEEEDLHTVRQELLELCRTSGKEKHSLKVFSPEDLDELLKKTAAEFLQLLGT